MPLCTCRKEPVAAERTEEEIRKDLERLELIRKKRCVRACNLHAAAWVPAASAVALVAQVDIVSTPSVHAQLQWHYGLPRREDDKARRIATEGWDRFAPVSETNKPYVLTSMHRSCCCHPCLQCKALLLPQSCACLPAVWRICCQGSLHLLSRRMLHVWMCRPGSVPSDHPSHQLPAKAEPVGKASK
jgi:hypothetical protein